MTRDEKMLAIQKMERNPRVTHLWYDESILLDNKEDSIWYNNGDFLLSFTLDEKYQITFLVSGEKSGTILFIDEENKLMDYDFKNFNTTEKLFDVKAESDLDIVYDVGFDCATAEEFLKAIKEEKETAKASITMDMNNWFEFEIIDIKEADVLTEAFGTDVVSDFDDMFNLIEIADDYIEEYNS